MRYPLSTLLSALVLSLSACASPVERQGTQMPPPAAAFKPVPDVTAPEPSGMAPPPDFVGPTENITKVGRAIQVRAKSLTTLVVVQPGLALTEPVTISILLGGYAPTRVTQTYVPSTGNHFLHYDQEGDGEPRRAFVDITLTEPNPQGGVFTATIPGSVLLDPLYDVSISGLDFKLIDDCDLFGLSEVNLRLMPPDGVLREVEFLTDADKPSVNFGQFAWSRTEVSASENWRRPSVDFYEHDPGFLVEFRPGWLPPPFVNLVPGKTEMIVHKLTDVFGDCEAFAQYKIKYTLRYYPFL